MLSYRLSTVNDFYWGFKPVLSYSKPHTFSTLFGKEKEINIHLLSPTSHVETKQNVRKVQRSRIKREKCEF